MKRREKQKSPRRTRDEWEQQIAQWMACAFIFLIVASSILYWVWRGWA